MGFYVNKIINGVPYTCWASNLSRGGLMVHPINEPWVGESVVGLQFQIPGQRDLIFCRGEVMHDYLADGAIGIRFTFLEPTQRSQINAFIEQKLKAA